MNWYKQSQQQLLLYPYENSPAANSEKIRPIGIDPSSQQNIYTCSLCKHPVLEEDIASWYTNKENEGASYQLPKYDEKKVIMAFQEIAQYLLPFYNQLQEYIKKENLESKRNETYDYGFRSALYRWEVQVPQLPIIINKYNEIKDICYYKDRGYAGNGICSLLSKTEINGDQLNNLSSLILNPGGEAEKLLGAYSGDEFSINYSVPICEDCVEKLETCETCGNIIFPGEEKYETTWRDNDYICRECIENGRADVCIECGKADSSDDMRYVEDQGSFCSNCYKEATGERIDWAKDVISNLDIPVGKNLPLSEKVLNNLFEFLNSYIRKYGNNYFNEQEKGRLNHLANKARLSEGSKEYLNYINEKYGQYNRLSDILNSIDNNIAGQNYMKEKYPNLSSYSDLPFDIDVEENYNNEKQGFTITVTPSEEFFDYAEKKYPQIREIWRTMKNTPHHSGVLAYARCAYEGSGMIVINNLQRDADFDNWESRTGRLSYDSSSKEAAKWFDNATKSWDVFLLNLIKSMAVSEDINAYLTTFDHQKKKWNQLPIHKSRKTYQEIPERMGFELTDPEGASSLTEDRGFYNDSFYQVANDIGMNWYKKAQQAPPIAITSYISAYGELGISFNGGQQYTYPDVSPFIYDKIKNLLKYKNYLKVQNMLKNLSAKNQETDRDKEQMLNQLYDEGHLK